MTFSSVSFLISYTSNEIIEGAKIPFSRERMLQNVSKNKPVRLNEMYRPSMGVIISGLWFSVLSWVMLLGLGKTSNFPWDEPNLVS